jgi:hypothetical protein
MDISSSAGERFVQIAQIDCFIPTNTVIVDAIARDLGNTRVDRRGCVIAIRPAIHVRLMPISIGIKI